MDACDEDQRRVGRFWLENARIVLSVAILALELDEPADRQPVERVNVSPLDRSTFARGGKPIPNSSTRTCAARTSQEVTQLVDDHEQAQHEDEHDDRDQGLDDGHQCVPPMGPEAKTTRTSTVEFDEPFDVRIRPVGSTETLDSRLEQAWDAGKIERTVEEPFYRDLVGGNQCRRGSRSGAAASRAMRSAGNRSSSGGSKSSRPMAIRSAAAAGEGRRSG